MLAETAERAKHAGNIAALLSTLMQQAQSYEQLGDTNNQEQCYLQCAELAGEIGDQKKPAQSFHLLGYLHEPQRNLRRLLTFVC